MQQHPYLRAYMAGIVVPTLVLLVAMTVFTVSRYVYHVPLDVERIIVFPMTIVPNLWGLWNILYIALVAPHRMSIGAFGAILPLLLMPGGLLLAKLVDFNLPFAFPTVLLVLFPLAIAVYYLAWKYIVGSLNRIVGVA